MNEFTFVNARAALGFGVPGSSILHQFRPKRISAALNRLHWMDVAARRGEEVTLRVRWLAKPQDVLKANYKLLFKSDGGHSKELRDSLQIVLRDVDEALRVTTARASGLAGEANHP